MRHSRHKGGFTPLSNKTNKQYKELCAPTGEGSRGAVIAIVSRVTLLGFCAPDRITWTCTRCSAGPRLWPRPMAPSPLRITVPNATSKRCVVGFMEGLWVLSKRCMEKIVVGAVVIMQPNNGVHGGDSVPRTAALLHMRLRAVSPFDNGRQDK